MTGSADWLDFFPLLFLRVSLVAIVTPSVIVFPENVRATT
jgi:hypothetical protein